MNQFTKWVNRFRPLHDKTEKEECYEDWCVSNDFWVDSKCLGWRLIRFKIDWIDSG